MALDITQLETKLKQILGDPKTESNVDAVAAAIAGAVDAYVKGATIVYTSGLVAPQGPVTGVFKGKLE